MIRSTTKEHTASILRRARAMRWSAGQLASYAIGRGFTAAEVGGIVDSFTVDMNPMSKYNMSVIESNVKNMYHPDAWWQKEQSAVDDQGFLKPMNFSKSSKRRFAFEDEIGRDRRPLHDEDDDDMFENDFSARSREDEEYFSKRRRAFMEEERKPRRGGRDEDTMEEDISACRKPVSRRRFSGRYPFDLVREAYSALRRASRTATTPAIQNRSLREAFAKLKQAAAMSKSREFSSSLMRIATSVSDIWGNGFSNKMEGASPDIKDRFILNPELDDLGVKPVTAKRNVKANISKLCEKLRAVISAGDTDESKSEVEAAKDSEKSESKEKETKEPKEEDKEHEESETPKEEAEEHEEGEVSLTSDDLIGILDDIKEDIEENPEKVVGKIEDAAIALRDAAGIDSEDADFGEEDLGGGEFDEFEGFNENDLGDMGDENSEEEESMDEGDYAGLDDLLPEKPKAKSSMRDLVLSRNNRKPAVNNTGTSEYYDVLADGLGIGIEGWDNLRDK